MPLHEQDPLRSTPLSGAPLSTENLGLLYQGIITAAVRVRAGDQPIGDMPSFRKYILDMKAEAESEALRLKYEKRHVDDATFAVVAYVDETVFSSNDPNRNQWPALQTELFGKAVGGEDFFKRLDDLGKEPDSRQLADTLEVYLLCLLLGYQGRYGKVNPGEPERVGFNLRRRIDSIRGTDERLSPDGVLLSRAPGQVVLDRATPWLSRVVIGFVVIVVGLWLFCRMNVNSEAAKVVEQLREVH